MHLCYVPKHLVTHHVTFHFHNYFTKVISALFHLFRTSYFSALLRIFPHFSAFPFPCLPLFHYNYSPVRSFPYLCFILLSFTIPFRTVHWLLRYSLCNPYIRYSVHTRY